MKRIPFPTPWACLFALSFVLAQSQTYIWNGLEPTHFQNNAVPPFNGTDNLVFGDSVSETVYLAGNVSVNSITLISDNHYLFTPSSLPLTLSIISGAFISSSGIGGSLILDPNIDVSLSGSPTFDSGSGSMQVSGHISGSANLTLLGSSSPQGSFIFSNTDTGNSYTGNTTIGSAAGTPAVRFWNSSPFGTGSVSFYNGGNLSAFNTLTIANALTLNTGGNSTSYSIRSWEAPLTFSGAVTLANNVTLAPQSTAKGVEFANTQNSAAVPGQLSRHPIIFTGAIGESGGSRSLTVNNGAGIVILKPASGTNTYSGGTTVNGTLIFGNNNAIPTGSSNVLVNGNGYVGLGDLSAGNFAAQIGPHVNKSSSGAVGIDTLPGNTTVTFSEDINLSSSGTGALSFTNASVRLGTATSAILTGNLTPQGTNYLFGNGGGSLYVQTWLGDTAGNGNTASRNVTNNSPTGVPPLKLFLQGVNSYSGGTTSNGGFVFFDGIAALPVAGALVASGSSTSVGNSYLGYTDIASLSSSTFLSRFTAGSTWGIVGFDTHAGNSTATVTGVNLTGFNDGMFIGTATSAILSGTLTPTTVANANNAANTLRLTAGNGGTLTVASTLADSGPPLALMLGSPATSNANFANGTVVLNGTNTYTGGTTLNANSQGLTVALGNNSAFGSGLVTIASNGSGLAGLEATTGGINLPNDLAFGNFANLHLLGNNSFTLSGDISGNGSIQMQRTVSDVLGAATLAGDNLNFTGSINLQHSTLTLAHNNAAGHTQINFFDATSTVVFAGAAAAPTLYGIDGAAGSLVLPNSTALTFDISDADPFNFEFGGVISGAAGAVTSASLTVTSSNANVTGALYLDGDNKYSGGTTVANYGVLALGHNNAAGTGPVTVNAIDGGLLLNTGVTFTNPLTFTAGVLAGFGTFDPSNLSAITFGSGRFVSPGVRDNASATGTLTFNTDIIFANGGEFSWSLQDVSRVDGFSQLYINGNLDLTTLSTGGFTLTVNTLDALGDEGFTNLTIGTPYTFTILQTTGTILGFDPADFTIDSTDFQSGTLSSTQFALTLGAGSQSLLLNFTPVPEPSTYALLVLGLGLLVPIVRRTRAGLNRG